MRNRKRGFDASTLEQVAGNGLLHRRALLGGGVAFAGALTAGPALTGAAADALEEPEWSLAPGDVTPVLQKPSRFEAKVVRTLSNPKGDARTQHARAPLHMLEGTITPNPVHFTILHSGIPDIDPDKHMLVIHGLVKQPLEFTVDALLRYPMVTRKCFVECGGNSAPMFSPEPIQATLQALHGLVSCAEWTGVPLSILLDEAGADPAAKWLIAEGADSLAVSRSVPMKKATDDAMVALYQNGERLMPGNGYPMRLLLPGYEGNMNVKFLRRLKVVDQPAMTYYESRTYSGLGRIEKVQVSADGGKSWGDAAVEGPVSPQAFTRFRMPWRWDGQPATLTSRAWDDSGAVQPLRADFIAVRGEAKKVPNVLGFPNQHYNSLTAWAIDATGEIKHVYV
jgi:sulfane dehydrogenase subunit SoxC